MIQHAELADQCARLALPLPCAVAFGFHGDQRAQGGANAGLEVGRTPERARHARLERLLRRALGLPVSLRGGDAGFGLAQIARQRQGRGFGDLVLAVKEVRGVVGTEIRLGMPTQRLGLVGGALDHLHGKPRAGVLKRRRPGRRGAIRGVLLQDNEVRHRLDVDQADPRMKGFVLAHRHRTRRHALGKRRALLRGHRDHGRFQGDIQRMLRAVADPDEGRQSAQLQELTHQPGAARRPQGDAEMRRQHQPMQPIDPLRGACEGRQARRRIPARNLPAPVAQGAARNTHLGGHGALRLPRRQPCFGRRDVLGLLQACASRHEPMLRPGLERPGSAAPALGLKSLSAGSSNIFSNPRLVCTSKGMKFRGSCQIPAHPSPSPGLGLGRAYEQRRRIEKRCVEYIKKCQ
ncbi:hypothetical protein [Thiocapsa sp.]|uniref:hypothetical protein n=1 Tax=Thiocapsa sp. TaxID=2024551 RepID=UPI00262AA327|nr:hypothetical protein [Thiocapsa sp.]